MHTDKLRFYSQHLVSNLLPDHFFRQKLSSQLDKIETYDLKEIAQRINYYFKPKTSFTLLSPARNCTDSLSLDKGKSAYYYDLLSCLRYFPTDLSFTYLFGDIRDIPEQPTFVKSRPITGDNQNSVLFKLNSVRHFKFVDDPYRFEDKKNIAIFRGACHQTKRKAFLERCLDVPNTNIGDTRKKAKGEPAYKDPISIKEHMKYKFIISVEGNDVASNLKWILNSNSLCFMTRPQYETWFMEGTLIPNQHYVLLKEDYSDLSEKIDYYSKHHSEAKKIVSNAQQFARQFQDKKKEKLISLWVMQTYFTHCNPGYRYAELIRQRAKQTRPVLPPKLSKLTD